MAKTQLDLTQGPIFKRLMLFSLPILLGAVVTEFYNLVDAVIVGRFVGANALAAVSAASPSTNVINMFLIGLQTGASVVVAQKVGAHDRTHLQDAVDTIYALTLISSVILVVGGLLAARPMLTALNTPEEIFSDAYVYMTIVFVGSAGNLIYNVGSGVLRGMGDSTWPFIFLLCCALLNLVLDLLSVTVFDFGVAGVAAATAIAQMVSGLGIAIRLNKSNYGAKVRFAHPRIVRAEATLLAAIALPAAVQNVGNTLAALFMQSYVNFFGANFAAANNIVTKVSAFADIPIVAVSSAICTFVGQNIGKGDLKRVHKGITGSILLLIGVGVAICAGLQLLKGVIPLAFTDEEEIIFYAAYGIGVIAWVSTFNGVDRVLLNAMRAAGRSVVPMITAQFGCFSRILFGYLIAVRLGDYRGIFYSMLLASFARMAAIAVYYYCFGGKQAIDRYPQKMGISHGGD